MGSPVGEVAAEPSDEGGVVGEDVSPVVEEPAAGDDVGEAGQAADAEDRQGEEEAAASADGHAVVDESALAFIYVGQASDAPTDIARAAFVLNGDAAVAEASLHFGGEGFEGVCQADV